MQGEYTQTTVNNGDYVVADLSQHFIRSGDISLFNINISGRVVVSKAVEKE